MRNRRNLSLWKLVLAFAATGACVDDGTDVANGRPPRLPLIPGESATTGHVPGGAEGGVPFFSGGAFSLAGDTEPGTATFTGAPVMDWMSPDEPALGAAAFDVSHDGVTYTATSAESLAAVFPDDATGTDYLVVGAWVFETDATGLEVARVVYVVVPAADFAVGATLALDGEERVALFAAGPADAEEPEFWAAALSGEVTFTAGGLAVGDLITATLVAEFGPVEWEPSEPPPPEGGELTAGDWELAVFGPADVWCDGTLIGHEADFAGVTLADAGFADGLVTLALTSDTTATLTGDVLTGAFGGATLELATGVADVPDGLWFGEAARSEAGPAGTTLEGAMLVLDGGSASASFVRGFAGVGYATADGAGVCQVGFGAQLSTP